jgi:hypothetical protein
MANVATAATIDHSVKYIIYKTYIGESVDEAPTVFDFLIISLTVTSRPDLPNDLSQILHNNK